MTDIADMLCESAALLVELQTEADRLEAVLKAARAHVLSARLELDRAEAAREAARQAYHVAWDALGRETAIHQHLTLSSADRDRDHRSDDHETR